MAPNNWNSRQPDKKPGGWGDRISDDVSMAGRRNRLIPQILEILGTHFVMAFAFLVILNLVGTLYESHAAEWVVTVFCIFLFIMAIFSEGSNNGRREHNLMNFGHLKVNPMRGLKAALLSQIPGAIATIVAVFTLFSNGGQPETPVLFYRAFYAPFVKVLQELESISPLLAFSILLVVPAIYHLGYTLGYKGISIREKLMYTQPKEGVSRKPKLK